MSAKVARLVQKSTDILLMFLLAWAFGKSAYQFPIYALMLWDRLYLYNAVKFYEVNSAKVVYFASLSYKCP